MFRPLHWWIEHLQGATAGVDVVMGEIRKAFENVKRVLVPGCSLDFTLPARHCELNGPNRLPCHRSLGSALR